MAKTMGSGSALDRMAKTMGSGSALDRMETRINAMEAMIESLKALKPATTAVYACSPTRRRMRRCLTAPAA
jgi:phage shock protein A